MKKSIALLLALAMVFALVLPAAAAETVPAIEATAEAENIKKYGNVVLSVTCEALFDAGYVYGDMLMLELCEEFDWVSISMKNDWTTIYGDGVTYTGAYTESEAAA